MTWLCLVGTVATSLAGTTLHHIAMWKRQHCKQGGSTVDAGQRPCASMRGMAKWIDGAPASVKTQENRSSYWEVVFNGSMNIRQSSKLYSRVIGKKQMCSIVAGERHGNWIKLFNEPGFMLVSYEGVVLLRESTVAYQKISRGKCADVGEFPITSTRTCRAAAVALGLQNASFAASDDAARAQGCYLVLDVHGSLRLVPSLAGTGSSASLAQTLCATQADADVESCRLTMANVTMVPPTTTSRPTRSMAPDTREPVKRASLFCFSVVTKTSGEEDLLRVQLGNEAGIFSCDESLVLSYGGKLELRKQETAELSVPETAARDPLSLQNATHLAQVVVRAWELVIQDGRFRNHDWTVKVDPDVVFFPERLRRHVEHDTTKLGKKLFLLNCNRFPGPPMLFGSLEVFSRGALDTYTRDRQRCQQMLPWQTMAEEKFMQGCLQLLGVGSVLDHDLVGDGSCWPASCADLSKVAFHKYQDVNSFTQCWEQANDAALKAEWQMDVVNADH